MNSFFSLAIFDNGKYLAKNFHMILLYGLSELGGKEFSYIKALSLIKKGNKYIQINVVLWNSVLMEEVTKIEKGCQVLVWVFIQASLKRAYYLDHLKHHWSNFKSVILNK